MPTNGINEGRLKTPGRPEGIVVKSPLAVYPNVAKAGGLQSQEESLSKINLEASSRKAGASEGEVVVFYFEPSATQNLKFSGFPRCFKGEQHGKIDPILRMHQWRYPEICHFAMILVIIADHYLIFAMLFMQLRGLCN